MKFSYSKNNKSGLDLTPLLDMIFIVLIFFMVAATFDLNRTIQLKLPKAFSGESGLSKDKILIEINNEGIISVNGDITEIQDISSVIREIDNFINCTVYLLADKDSYYKYVIEILDILKILGISNVSLVTDEKEEL